MSADSHFTTDGATIAYELTGSGRPVGYAHGVLLSSGQAHHRCRSSPTIPRRSSSRM
jgi:hypothetical protein